VLLGRAAEHRECLLRGRPVSLHERALRLPDQVPGIDGLPQVLPGPGVANTTEACAPIIFAVSRSVWRSPGGEQREQIQRTESGIGEQVHRQ
jgi:hypothetical protein